ncbi:putative nucleoside transporter [Lyophyllum shimeji]|uniref:Nucleoside transporter n=1 Tax=Lyophyllum shimeji TaxID=47721 RepID=A0A9P3UNK6_LYOSH|nr:putative nucleoside transporter [Lyophyllum shimeji]
MERHDHCHTILSLPTTRHSLHLDVHLLPLDILHSLTFHIFGACHGGLEADITLAPNTHLTFFHVAPGLFFTFVLVNGAMQAALDSHLQTSVVTVAAVFGPRALQAVMSGQAAVATVVSAVQALNTSLFLWKARPEADASGAVDGSAEEGSARMFFALCTFFLLISATAHNTLVAQSNYKELAAPLEQASVRERERLAEQQPPASFLRRDYITQKAHILRVVKANTTFDIAVAYVFIVTMAVFPAITTSVMPTNPNTHPLLFNSIHFLVLNTGDFLGRYICALPSLLIWSANRLLALSLARSLFIPLFLMCNVQRTSSSGLPLPAPAPIISSDILFMLIVFALGLSNGYISSLCMMAAPSLVHNPRLKGRKEDVDVAATVANFCIAAGLVIGSVASFAVRGVMCGCNPFIS